MTDLISLEGPLRGPQLQGKRIGVLHVTELVHDAGLSRSEVVKQMNVSGEEVNAALEYHENHPERMEQLQEWKESQIEAAQTEQHE
jgi:hypothetical protein